MLSLIICSREPNISNELENNISQTIGCEYELIVIDNSKRKYNIFKAYNEGVSRAKGDIICFMHDDIIYHSNNWGQQVLSYFKAQSLGIVGVLGSHYMPKCPAGWWNTQCQAGQIIQGYSKNNDYFTKKIIHNKYDSISNGISNVAVVDGLWFCIPRAIFSQVMFDEKSYKGFHCYDIDICMQVSALGYDVAVSYDILIEHKSLGTFNKAWVDALRIWYIKWTKMLPFIRGIENLQHDKKQEILARNCKYYSYYTLKNKNFLMAFIYYIESIVNFPYKCTKWKEYIAEYLFPNIYQLLKRTNK